MLLWVSGFNVSPNIAKRGAPNAEIRRRKKDGGPMTRAVLFSALPKSLEVSP